MHVSVKVCHLAYAFRRQQLQSYSAAVEGIQRTEGHIISEQVGTHTSLPSMRYQAGLEKSSCACASAVEYEGRREATRSGGRT